MRVTGGKLKNHSLKTLKGSNTRPTSEKLRQTVFNICQNQIENSHFLDLFAGSGAMGIEALSRGANSSTFIEQNRAAAGIIRNNLKALNLAPQSTLLVGDVLSLLGKLKGKIFDLIYVDPPYTKGLHEKTLLLLDNLEILSTTGTLFVEELSLKALPLKTLELKRTKKVGSTHLFEFTVCKTKYLP